MQTMFFGYYFGKLSVAVTQGERPEKGDWNEIDPSTLSDDLLNLYQTYKDSYSMMKEAKQAFENSMRREAGFRSTPKVAPKPVKKGLSLADFIACQKANGGAY